MGWRRSARLVAVPLVIRAPVEIDIHGIEPPGGSGVDRQGDELRSVAVTRGERSERAVATGVGLSATSRQNDAKADSPESGCQRRTVKGPPQKCPPPPVHARSENPWGAFRPVL